MIKLVIKTDLAGRRLTGAVRHTWNGEQQVVGPLIDPLAKTSAADRALASLVQQIRTKYPDEPSMPLLTSRVKQSTKSNFHHAKESGAIAITPYFHGWLKAGWLSKQELARERHTITSVLGRPKYMSLYSETEKRSIGASRVHDDIAYTRDNLAIDVIEERLTPIDDYNQKQMLARLMAADADEALLTDVNSALNEKTMDILTELAEAPETIGYIVSRLISILKTTRRFMTRMSKSDLMDAMREIKRDLAQAKKSPHGKNLAEFWLEYRYAIMPMVYSVEDALEVLKNKDVERLYVDERKRRVITAQSILNDNLVETQIHRAWSKRRIDGTSWLGQELQFNPFVTAWELTTFSFVIDWVLNVGSFLSALTQPKTWQEEAGTYSIKRTCSGYTNDLFVEYETYRRISIPNPSSIASLAINPYLTWERFLDLVSLGTLLKKDLRRSIRSK